MDKQLLAILVCPACKGPLHYQSGRQELICQKEGLAYPIRDDIPVMLIDDARRLSLEEIEALNG